MFLSPLPCQGEDEGEGDKLLLNLFDGSEKWIPDQVRNDTVWAEFLERHKLTSAQQAVSFCAKSQNL